MLTNTLTIIMIRIAIGLAASKSYMYIEINTPKVLVAVFLQQVPATSPEEQRVLLEGAIM